MWKSLGYAHGSTVQEKQESSVKTVLSRCEPVLWLNLSLSDVSKQQRVCIDVTRDGTQPLSPTEWQNTLQLGWRSLAVGLNSDPYILQKLWTLTCGQE